MADILQDVEYHKAVAKAARVYHKGRSGRFYFRGGSVVSGTFSNHNLPFGVYVQTVTLHRSDIFIRLSDAEIAESLAIVAGEDA